MAILNNEIQKKLCWLLIKIKKEEKKNWIEKNVWRIEDILNFFLFLDYKNVLRSRVSKKVIIQYAQTEIKNFL